MDIRPEASGIDPLARQRQLERLQRERESEAASGGSSESSASSTASDATDIGKVSTERFVNILTQMDPVDLHKVENLRARIADGSFTASPEELVDPLLEVLRGDRDEAS